MIPMSPHDLGRVVEDVVELRLAGEQVVEHRLARLAEVLGDSVQQLRVADLVLDLGGERELAAEGRRAHDPLALGEHAHELRVGVHLDEAQHGGPVLVRHPVVRLDLAARSDVRLEVREPLVVAPRRSPARARRRLPLGRRQDGIERERVGHAVSLRPRCPSRQGRRSDSCHRPLRGRSRAARRTGRPLRSPSGRCAPDHRMRDVRRQPWTDLVEPVLPDQFANGRLESSARAMSR